MKQQSFEDTREYKNWKVVVFSIIFFLILGVWFLVYYFFFNWKSKQPVIDNTQPVEQQQKKLDENWVDLWAKRNENRITPAKEWIFGHEYGSGWRVAEGFEYQNSPEAIKEKRNELMAKLKKRYPEITDEEANLVIGDINAYGWQNINILDNGMFYFGSKFLPTIQDLRKELEERMGTDAFTMYPADRDWWLIPIQQEEMWYDLTERNKEVDSKLVKSGDTSIQKLEEEVIKHWWEIYTPNPLKNLTDEKNQQRDVYFYQVLNNLTNNFKAIIKETEYMLNEQDKKELLNTRFAFAKHWNTYRVYPIGLSSELAQKINISNFDMTFYYADNKNSEATFKDKEWSFGAFGNTTSIEWLFFTRGSEKEKRLSEKIEFKYSDTEATEWKNMSEFLLTQRIAKYPIQEWNNINSKVFFDYKKVYGNDELRCYTWFADDMTLKIKMKAWTTCLLFDRTTKQLKGMVNESDTAYENSTMKDTPLVSKGGGFNKADVPVLTTEQKAQNERVDKLIKKYMQDEIKEMKRIKKENEDKLAKNYGFKTIEEMDKAIKKQQEAYRDNFEAEYDENYDFSKFKPTDWSDIRLEQKKEQERLKQEEENQTTSEKIDKLLKESEVETPSSIDDDLITQKKITEKDFTREQFQAMIDNGVISKDAKYEDYLESLNYYAERQNQFKDPTIKK